MRITVRPEELAALADQNDEMAARFDDLARRVVTDLDSVGLNPADPDLRPNLVVDQVQTLAADLRRLGAGFAADADEFRQAARHGDRAPGFGPGGLAPLLNLSRLVTTVFSTAGLALTTVVDQVRRHVDRVAEPPFPVVEDDWVDEEPSPASRPQSSTQAADGESHVGPFLAPPRLDGR